MILCLPFHRRIFPNFLYHDYDRFGRIHLDQYINLGMNLFPQTKCKFLTSIIEFLYLLTNVRYLIIG